MYFGRFVSLSFIFWTVRNLEAQITQEIGLLQNAMNALYNGLQYMEDHVAEINLDGAFGCRLVEGIFQAFIERRPSVFDTLGGHLREDLEMLSEKAGRIADVAKYYVKMNDPGYYAAVGGVLLERSEVLLWYPGRLTKSALVVTPLSCTDSYFNETLSDSCLKELHGTRSEETDACYLSELCLDFMTKPRQRGYMITHQVLYFQLMEMENCVKRSQVKIIPKRLQDTLCSNVMRDAEEIAASNYPLNHHDLFMEQIGLCSLWGYKDFYNPKWLIKILQWQKTSGCYANRAVWYCTENLIDQHIRTKREEVILKDDCLSHKTGVALLAIAGNIRFIAEKISEIN